jgi:hypothetical protein
MDFQTRREPPDPGLAGSLGGPARAALFLPVALQVPAVLVLRPLPETQ